MRKSPDKLDKIKARLRITPRTLNLRKKILLSMVALVLVSGLTTVLITRIILLNVLRTGFQQKGLSAARSIAASAVMDVLTQNTGRLKQRIENEKSLDRDIAYAFVVDPSGRILAHTFNKGFPVNLLAANELNANQEFNTQTLDTQQGLIYDIAVPVFLENSVLAKVRLGILQSHINQTIARINLIFLGATLLIVFLGVLLAYRISSLITKPISKLVQATQSIQKGDFSVKLGVNTNDEIGLLSCAFNEMASRLNQMVEQIKRLTAVEERNRIALDLHDGCAQNIASIIKRIEFCDKLFKIDPQKAFKELEELREDTRDILDITRQVIFDLKLPENANFNLLNNLNSYVKGYQKQNDINVKLSVSGSFETVSPDKSKQIFYIIREAFANIRKHAQAKNVELRLDYGNPQELLIDIKDDGKGFDIEEAQISASSRGKLGLISMRQRTASLGGTLDISSIPEQGTEISIRIPFNGIAYSI